MRFVIQHGCELLSASQPESPSIAILAHEQPKPVVEIDAIPTIGRSDADRYDYLLTSINGRLTLRDTRTRRTVDVCVDFSSAANRHRLRNDGCLRHPLSRAVNARRPPQPFVCDATAGLGQDAFVLAACGCRILLFERSAIVHALLRDGLQRAASDPDIAAIAKRMTLQHGDAHRMLAELNVGQAPDVVYLDPMYPATKKSAASKKGMRALQTLLAADKTDAAQSADTLLPIAIATARRRVVVKRPLSARSLEGAIVSGAIVSGKTRYDIYAGKQAAARKA